VSSLVRNVLGITSIEVSPFWVVRSLEEICAGGPLGRLLARNRSGGGTSFGNPRQTAPWCLELAPARRPGREAGDKSIGEHFADIVLHNTIATRNYNITEAHVLGRIGRIWMPPAIPTMKTQWIEG